MSELMKDIYELSGVMSEIKRLTAKKDELIEAVVNGLGHEKEGQAKYTVDNVDVEIRTPPRYKVIDDEYEAYRGLFPACMNPVEVKQSYKVNPKLYKEALLYASDDERSLLDKMVVKEIGKPSVKISFS